MIVPKVQVLSPIPTFLSSRYHLPAAVTALIFK